MDSATFGFIGAGQMAQALIAGLFKSGLAVLGQVVCSDPRDHRKAEALGARGTARNLDVVAAASVVVIAVKPDVVATVLEEIKGAVDPQRHLIITIAGGIPLAVFEAVGLGFFCFF